MIRSFADSDTEELFHGGNPRRVPPDIRVRARRKLDQVNAAASLNDLRVPPGNMLEALHGDRKGQYSIRVNEQWRVCFRFEAGEALDVEVVDYH
ncbi:MAG: plasmid maintenance system killer [Deltaproteobacteria bacterium RBG_16_71_12]|nr:MAG: plasmid maintenance system killer [Deltaproteobacteria bacterium RBG_16_71_12]HJW74670.1 type II toxin-antitoxin system RelE/ParE family toxin [Thermoleophilia bacterium]